ncbi:pyridoxamine 5'-phosphate oxidase family protein [Prauserella cavernicola]|uniref:Pyridoxamine 5'-phosphate oxidase family protein n=1 Tax=Prauserella cavernicola TaxID=2800127 RepID=A0A934QNJ9_9PSEU|nr:pyridoxamine 5'-phosphate oxidase family protein [Prauserella cavernicola]MBK1782839.1 pyridoxamine 5'-phosphate oxidase family protein [Prauserella cavernicola]
MLDSFGLEVLHRDECVALLTVADLGRVVFTHHGLPAVQPVRFVLRDGAVFCAVPGGSALYAAARGTVIAFEAELFAPDLSGGWFVTVVGRAGEPREEDLTTGLPELSWQPSPGDRYLRIPLERISGRRV